jgi:hypothetical protein
MKTGSANRVNAPAFGEILFRWLNEDPKAYVELVSSMPGQGVASMFSFGHSAGVIQGALGAFEIPVTMVTPSRGRSARVWWVRTRMLQGHWPSRCGRSGVSLIKKVPAKRMQMRR